MTGSWVAGREGLHMLDDKVGTEFQGETAGTGDLPRVRELIGEEFTGCAPPNLARHGKMGVGAGG